MTMPGVSVDRAFFVALVGPSMPGATPDELFNIAVRSVGGQMHSPEAIVTAAADYLASREPADAD